MDWLDIGGVVLGHVLPVLGSVLAALIGWGLRYVIQRWKLDWLAAHEAGIRSSVRAAIHGAEEWAARKAKADLAPSGAEKALVVHRWLTKKYPDVLPEELEQLVDEELGLSRLGASPEAK